MELSLPPVKPGKVPSLGHFPTRLQAFVFRNWEMIPAETLAAVLDATPEAVRALAEGMGLPPQEPDPRWLTAGYVTVIKNNWHLLPYGQLAALLGWSEEKLAYVIKEDDFLDVKLGYFKPDVPKLTYAPLTPEEEAETARLRADVEKGLGLFAPVTAKPFDFWKDLRPERSAAPAPADSRFELRIAYSYCALYGDVFTGDFEASFPEKLLEAYRAAGVNGVWVQAVLYTLVEFPFAPELSAGWEARAEGLRALTERLDAYGIKLYLYLNEPRGMPEKFFDARPELKGAVRADGMASLCTSVPAVREYLRESAAKLARCAPKLGGFITITASENVTNCYSHFEDGQTNCPRCRRRARGEVLGEVNALLYAGAAAVNPGIRLLAWNWGWTEADAELAARNMPREIGLMAVSERGVEKTVGGIRTSVRDYSISMVGPGETARRTWELAARTGRPAYAKCQFNNTWECCTVPFLPVFDTVYTHASRLTERGVSGVMLDWTLGGYPSPTFSMLKFLFDSTGEFPSLEEAYAAVFPRGALPFVREACARFSAAFDQYPFHIQNLYRGPQNLGCGNLLWPEPTGWTSTMTCFPYDDLENWRAIFPEEVFEAQLRALTEQWAEGLRSLEKLPAGELAASRSLRELRDAAEAAYLNFRSAYLQTRFIRVRDGKSAGDLAAIIDEEQANTVRTACVAARNATIGYESANQYFFTRSSLLEKFVNCAYVRRVMLS